MGNRPQDMEGLLRTYRERLADVHLHIPELERLAVAFPQALPARPHETWDPRTLLDAVSYRKRPAQILLAASLCLALFLWRNFGGWPWVIHRWVDLPFAQATGLAIKENTLLIADNKKKLLFTLAADRMQVESVRRFSNPFVSGLAWGNGSLWSTDRETGRIYQHGLGREYPILRAYENQDRSPGAVFWDGASLWTSDLQAETICQFAAGDLLKPVRQYSLPGIAVAGIQVQGHRLWVLDSITQAVYEYELDSELSLHAEKSIHLNRWLSPYCVLTGLAISPSALWVVSDNPAQLHRFDLRRIGF